MRSTRISLILYDEYWSTNNQIISAKNRSSGNDRYHCLLPCWEARLRRQWGWNENRNKLPKAIKAIDYPDKS